MVVKGWVRIMLNVPEAATRPFSLDDLDRRVLREMVAQPRLGISELAERLGVARNTAHSRLTRLERHGVLTHRDREIDPATLGMNVTAFVTLQLTQGRLGDTIAELAAVPYVLEAHAVAGNGDLLVRVAAHNTRHLHDVINVVLACTGVRHSVTSVVMTEQIPYRVAPLIDTVIAGAGPQHPATAP
jgi:DNA-binding Lrp family transcriptional regulator